MPKIRYIGQKDVKDDNVANTGTRWLGYGDVQDVPAEAVAALMRHSEVFELVDQGESEPPRRPHVPMFDNTKVVLLGSDALDKEFEVAGRVVTQAEAIQHAFAEDSDLTEEQWNALTEEERTSRIVTALEHIESGHDHPDKPVPLLAEGLAPLSDEALRAIVKERGYKVHHTKKGDALREAILAEQAKAAAAEAGQG